MLEPVNKLQLHIIISSNITYTCKLWIKLYKKYNSKISNKIMNLKCNVGLFINMVRILQNKLKQNRLTEAKQIRYT